jgi:hypothetical protein
MLTGKTTLIAHLGYPTEAFTAPMIYNPWFERAQQAAGPLSRRAPAIAPGADVMARRSDR